MKRLLPILVGLVSCGNGHVRFVKNSETYRSDLDGKPAVKVIAARYGTATRAVAGNPWDLFDPVTKAYVAPFKDGDKVALYAVRGDKLEKVTADLAAEPLIHGVLSPDGKRLYLTTDAGAMIANRQGAAFSFGAFSSVGHDVKIVHDVSWNGKLAIASGHKPIKWENPSDVVAPRQMSVFEINADGTFGKDVSKRYPPLKDFVQSPVFTRDGLIYEGDDDLDTGDHLFHYRIGKGVTEIVPAKVKDRDFNTPCVTADGRVAFFESVPKQYLVRLYDPKTKKTTTVHDEWLPHTGYVRCR